MITGFVLASLRGSTYQQTYASPLRSLRPCRMTILSIRQDNVPIPLYVQIPHFERIGAARRQGLEERLDAEVVDGTAEEDRNELAAAEALDLTGLFVVPSYIPPHRAQPLASSYHRFAMVALAVAGLASQGGIEIDDADCVSISFPSFFELLGQICLH